MRWPEGYARKSFDTLNSTNSEARRLAEAGETGPLWITAARQTAGRGRRGRVWQSPEGNLAATLLIRPEKPVCEWPELSFVAALATAAAISSLGQFYEKAYARVMVKWPNDVLMDGAKVAGILLESGGGWLAIGIGMNLASFPPETEYPATSLAERGVNPPASDVALTVLAHGFAWWYRVWQIEGFEPVRKRWRELAVGLGQRIRARIGDEERFGLFEDIDSTGALLLRDDEGRITRIAAADIFPVV